MDPKISEFDQALFNCIQGIDILDAVTPLNFADEKARFFASQFAHSPEFVYAEDGINVFDRKRQLFNLPIEDLADSDLQKLYVDVIESYVDKLDQYQSIGTPDFLYDNLRYYGEPSRKDISNANFVMHLPSDLDDVEEELFGVDDIVSYLNHFAERHDYPFNLVISDSMIANALVSGDRVKVNRQARVNQTELNALAHHELGVHLVTTLNARAQPLKVLALGSPVNTTSQEGLAILCEYLAGSLTLERLKVLALRVLAVDSMIQEKDFRRTFLLLKEQYGASEDKAFTITARVYRGGGFTKDYLYLRGFHELLNTYEHDPHFQYLLCGKVSLEHTPLISRLVEKGLLIAPQRISPAIATPTPIEPVHKFIAHSIK